ncbi:hypothetical protein C5S29_06210 [ANME-1 cluster archaeon GoMg3.2]|nr:hypothetical protein [ANME-1 cluster archaeon GoMg3.2]
MEDKEIRTEILNALREEYNKNPHGIVMKVKLLSELNISENELERNIKYLSDKGLIDVKWFLGGGTGAKIFFAKINSYGIDRLEQSIEEVTETEGDALKHIFDETKEFVDVKLEEICPDALEKLKFCYNDLLSDSHPHKNALIAFNCREILKDFTDAIFKDEYLQNDESKPSRNQTKNKLSYTLRAIKIESETTRKMLETQIEYLSNYFDNLDSFIQKNTHPDKFEVTGEDAKRCVIYTYLVIADVLKLLDKNDNLGFSQEG